METLSKVNIVLYINLIVEKKMITTADFLEKQEEKYKLRKNEILEAKDNSNVKGKVYYVSNDGNDDNDGLSPEKPWKTLEKVSEGVNDVTCGFSVKEDALLKAGDAVLFKRGDLFRGGVRCVPGVHYGAYGIGDKPKFYGGEMDYAKASMWSLFNKEKHIYKLNSKINDPGTFVFNHGERHSRKLIPSYRNGTFVCRDNEEKIFNVENEMTDNLDIFWHFDDELHTNPSKGENFPVPKSGANFMGNLYLRCDEGNPGEVFKSIETISRDVAFRVGNKANVTIDNLCIKYYCFGVHASGHSVGLTVKNCEIGWIGGNIQHYDGTDPNYPEGRRGSVTRFGNCIEIYGGCENFTVDGNYLYQCFDAGATHQVTTNNKVVMKNIRYSNNLIEKCVYGIEYFLDQIEGERESCMENLAIYGNIIRLSGYGWGQQRHNVHTPALIKGWSYVNTAKNYKIYNNTFDRSAYRMLHLVALKDEFCPEMYDNIYIQNEGGMLGQYGGNEFKEPEIIYFDENTEENIKNVFKHQLSLVYIIRK